MPNDRRTLVRLATLAVLGAALLAAACTGDDGTPTASPTATATATASPSAAPGTATVSPTSTPSPTRPPAPTPLPQPPATPGRFTIQLIDFDSPEAVGIRRDTGLITATADGIVCTAVDADVLEPPAIVLGAPDQPEECRREGAWVALFSGDPQLGTELWEHFRLRVGRAATLANYATGTPSEWPVTDGAGVFQHAGVLVVGFEIAALFGGHCPVAGSPSWISPPDDLPFFDMVVDASGAPAPDPFDIAMYRVGFFGEISPFGSYGHDGQYRYEIVPMALESAELAADCDWGAASELTEARARWDAAATSDYRFTLQRSCECPDEWSAPTEVTVRDGVVASATLQDGTPAPTGAALTIEELFDEIAEALNQPVASAVTYDAELGHPLDVQLDLEAIAVDGGLSLTVSDLERLD